MNGSTGLVRELRKPQMHGNGRAGGQYRKLFWGGNVRGKKSDIIVKEGEMIPNGSEKI